jgi:hypothetical protein
MDFQAFYTVKYPSLNESRNKQFEQIKKQFELKNEKVIKIKERVKYQVSIIIRIVARFKEII